MKLRINVVINDKTQKIDYMINICACSHEKGNK